MYLQQQPQVFAAPACKERAGEMAPASPPPGLPFQPLRTAVPGRTNRSPPARIPPAWQTLGSTELRSKKEHGMGRIEANRDEGGGGEAVEKGMGAAEATTYTTADRC